MVRVQRVCMLFVVALLLSCAAKQAPASVVAPPVPVPPKDPWAWLPEDASFIGQLVLAPFRGTPLWPLWENARKDQPLLGTLIHPEHIERAAFAGRAQGSEALSFVAALSGPFGAGSVDAAAVQHGFAKAQYGLLTVYRTESVAVAQVYPDLIIACSIDRLAWLGERSTAGPTVRVFESALYQSLAARVSMAKADFALLAEDRGGEAKAQVARRAKQLGVSIDASDLVRGGAAVTMGEPTQLSAAVETVGAAQAGALKSSVESALSGLASNVVVGLLGLRPIVVALATTQDGNYVQIAGSVKQADFNRGLDRLADALGAALASGAAASP